MKTLTYQRRRSQLQTYFDRTAAEAWMRLTSDHPVSRIRETVRLGRDQMRTALLDRLPADLSGQRLLDAGCGTGMLAVAAAQRGAEVVAIDLSSTLVDAARERLPDDLGPGRIEFRVGDMLDPTLGRFDHVVAMDSLIHYRRSDMVEMIGGLSQLADRRVVFTFAPRTFLLTMMHLVGRLFPRSDRAPSIEPIRERSLRRGVAAHPVLAPWRAGYTHRIQSGFYTSQLLELTRS